MVGPGTSTSGWRARLAIRLGFHNHAPQQIALGLALDQQAADEARGNQFHGTGEEGMVEGLGGLGWLIGYGGGL